MNTPLKPSSELVAEAKKNIENLSPQQVQKEKERSNTILVDLRESEERKEQGVIPGAIHAPRGMLEFYADPSSPYHKKEFDPNNRIVLHCAGGGRSALAASTLKQMGYKNVAHLEGGFKSWKGEGLPVEQAGGSAVG